jgi:flagellar motor switch/type III secretory pathway protein FliN
VIVESVHCGFDFPEEFDRLTPIEILGEPAVIGFDMASAERLVQCVVPKAGEHAQDIILEYLEKRFVTTVQKSWVGKSAFSCYHCSSTPLEQIEVAGAVLVDLRVAGEMVRIAIGVGINAIELIDMQWRELLIQETPSDEPLDSLQEFSIELTQLSVPHELLVDFLQPGNVIPLEQEVSDRVIVMKNGEAWASAKLMQFNGRFAAQILEPFPPTTTPSGDAARILATFAVTELDCAGGIELMQPGALLLTREEIAPNVSLFISGEEVAVAEIGSVDGSFVLTVLQR